MVLKPMFKFFFIFWVFILYLLFAPVLSYSADVGNCLLCHKYPGLNRIGDEGKFRLFYINEDVFTNSIHTKVKCEGCHADIKKIPHDPAEKVDCLRECHITEPSSEQKFSHKEVATFLSKSVHTKVDKNQQPKKYSEDMPYCLDCHDNPLYRPLSFFKKVRPGISEMALGRCRVCHKKDEFIFRFYNHITTRLHTTRSPKNIAEMCGRCHDDAELVEKHDLSTKAVYSYGETFHGKAASFFDERIPDCLDCHINRGESIHQMLSHEDPLSVTHVNNKSEICSNIECHPSATPKLANYKVHMEFDPEQSPREYYFKMFFIALTGGTLLPLMGIMFLDLFRRLFPNIRITRRK
ncbi:MAG: cytochrome C [Thermodesulfovibrionia bacterium]|nr:cytochrome C [Thermodesulfovibrionia bacterium]